MSDVRDRLQHVLAQLGESAAFAVSGTLPPALPGLEVRDACAVGLPVSAEDARRLISVASQAPYGRGADTIVDTDVRRVWQIEPSQFELRNPEWESRVETMVRTVAEEFALGGKVRHELYKLLVYETGSFFAPHRDTEKTPGMFATLVVCLPSRHEGGSLIVQHEGDTVRIDFGGPDSEFRMGYAAFYADCRHEITPLESGYRVCLVYNLALKRGPQPSAPENSKVVSGAAALLREVFSDPSYDLRKLVIPLEHQYTEEGLHPGALKGADRAHAEVLARAAASLDFECSLALVVHHQTGSVDLDTWIPPRFRSRRSYRRGYYEEYDEADDEAADIDEVYEESITLDHWLDMDGEQRPFGALHVAEEELLCGDDREGWSISQEIREATGNEGASLDRWYRSAALVIWPRSRLFDILASEGQAVALPELERMASEARDEAALSACRTFAGAIINRWTGLRLPGDQEPYSSRMLSLLEGFGTVELVQQFVRETLPRDFCGTEGPAIRRLCERLGWEALRPSVSDFMERQQPAPYDVAPNRLLALLSPLYAEPATWTEERRRVCTALAHDLARVMERWSHRSTPTWSEYAYYPYSSSRPRREPGLVANAVRIFAAGSQTEALEQFMGRALRGELGCDLHEVLIPDLKAIAGWLVEVPAARPAYKRLRDHCIAQLCAATAERPEPPVDWRRDAELGCPCAECKLLARFLADPKTRTERFPLREERRQHLEHQIRQHQSDCTCETERKGRPYTLICTKNQASYEQRERQYQIDRKLLAEIERLPSE